MSFYARHFLIFIAMFAVISSVSSKDVTSQLFLLDPKLPNNATLFSAMQTRAQLTAKDVEMTQTQLKFKTKSGAFECTLSEQAMQENEWYAFSTIAWLWKSASTDLRAHKGFININFTPNPQIAPYSSDLEMAYVISAMIEALPNNAIGMLNAERYLLLDSFLYQETVKNLAPGETPIYLMLYFGMAKEGNKNSAFTYGMEYFNLPNIEIVHSEHTMHEIHDMIVDSATHMLSEVTPTKLAPLSEGVYIEGKTLKL